MVSSVGRAYTNAAIQCSSISIVGDSDTTGGVANGSNEFIVSEKGRKTMPSTSRWEIGKSWVKRKAQSICSTKTLNRKLPITVWLPKYNTADAVGDLVAGITVGLTIIPQGLACAGIAGLPAAYGLYGSFLGCFFYIFLGSCKDVPLGPSAVSALLTMQTAHGSWQKATLLCFLCGIIELLMGLFNLGFLVDFVSGPVSSGFTSAVAIIALTSQVKDIFGIPVKGSTFVQIWKGIFRHISETRFWDTILGISCIAILLIVKQLAGFKIGPKDDTLKSREHKIFNKLLWLMGTARNAVLVVICGSLGFYFQHMGNSPFILIGDVPSGLPSVEFPYFSLSGNETQSGKDEDFFDLVTEFGSGLIVIPLIALMETMAVCKTFGNGKPVDATQELIALGVGNIANSFVKGFPGTGALGRGAINNASGVRTPFGNIYTSIVVILALLLFTPYFFCIPKATLAAIIITAVIFMVEVKVVKPMWRTKKIDLLPGLGTFFACLAFPLEVGILIGIGLNMIFVLYIAARPKITVETLSTPGCVEYLMITPDRCLIFPSVEYVRHLVTKHSIRQNLPVVIDCTHIYGADFTAATVIDNLSKDFARRKQNLFFYNVKPSVCTIFEGLAPADFTVLYRKEQLDDVLQMKEKESSIVSM